MAIGPIYGRTRSPIYLGGTLFSEEGSHYILSEEHQIATFLDLTRLDGVGAYLETRVIIGIVVTSLGPISNSNSLSLWSLGRRRRYQIDIVPRVRRFMVKKPIFAPGSFFYI